MAKQIESLQVRLEVAGGEQLSKLKSSFRALETTLGQSETGLRRARATLLDYGRGAQQSEALFRGMITALEGVRGQVEVNSSAFGELTQDIKGYSDALRGSTDAQERQRASLLAMGSGARRSAGDLREVITGLQTLRGEVRPGSSAFVQLGRDVATLQARLRGLTEESRAYRSVLGQALSAKPDVLARQLESFRRVLADTASSAEQLANAMRSIELLGVGAGRTGAVQREQIFSSVEGQRFFAQLRRSYEDLPKTAAVISQRIAEVNTELENTTSYETRRRLTQELIQLNRELKNTVVEITTAENMAAMALRQRMAARRAVSGGEGGFGAFSQEVTRRTAAGRYSRSGQDIAAYRQNEEAIKKALTDVEQAYNATEKAIQDSLNRRTDLEIKAQQEVDARLDAISERRLREMREEDAAYERSWMRRLEAADRYANSKAFSKQFLGLQGQELSPFYSRVVELGVGTPAIEASTYQKRGMARAATDVIEAFNLQLTEASRVANEGVGYFREAAIAHAGGSEKVREILGQWDAASIPENMYPLAGETGEQYRRRLVNGTNAFERAAQLFSQVLGRSGRGISSSTEAIRESAIDFAEQAGRGEDVRTALGRYRDAGQIPMHLLPRASVETPESYAQRVAGMQRGALPSIGDIKQASITKLHEFRSLLQEIRNDIPPIGKEFQRLDTQLGQTIQRLDEELQRRRPDAGGFNAGRLAQTAGAALSGAVFGGPEGFLGGVVGGIAGGPGGAFAGAAAGAQVAMLRQAAGGAAEYAAAINQQRRALSGVIEDSAAYQQSLAFIDQTSRQLAIPQEQVTRNFTRLSASVLGAGGDVAAAQEAFMGISAGIRATGGTLGDLDAALLATAQVFSKGKVSAEELRGQIGERLPGAFTLFAKSIGKTPQELDNMLEKGQVTLDDFMSFVRLMSSDYGRQALNMAASSEAAGDRLTTAFGRMQEEVGKALQPIGAQFQEMFADFVENVAPTLVAVLPKIGEAFLALAKNIDLVVAALVAFSAGAVINAARLGALTKVVFDLRLAVAGLNTALLLNPWVALAAGITAAAVGLYKYNQNQAEFNGLIKSGEGSTKEMNDAKYVLEKQLAAEKKRLEELKSRYGENGRAVKSVENRVRELAGQLKDLDRTYTVRLKLEKEGYSFDDKGNVASFTVPGVGVFDADGKLIRSAQSGARFGADNSEEAQKTRATSLLSLIEQREEAIANARIQLEKQAASIRENAQQQAKQLEENFAQQRLTREREIAAARRQLEGTQADVGFERAAFTALATGSDVELVRIQQRADEFRRQQDEARIQLEQRLADEQTQRAKSIEDLRVKTAEAINEANKRYAEAIGDAQLKYARGVAKLIEEGSGRAGQRLEAAAKLMAAYMQQASAGQAFTAATGVSVRATGEGSYLAGPDRYSSGEELIGAGMGVSRGVAGAALNFVQATEALREAEQQLLKLPSAASASAPAINSISVNTQDLTIKLKQASGALDNLGTELMSLGKDQQAQQAIQKFYQESGQITQGVLQTRNTMAEEAARRESVLQTREALGLSAEGASQYMDSLIREAETVERLTALYESYKDTVPYEVYKRMVTAITAASDATRELIKNNERMSASFTIRTAIEDTRDELNKMTDVGNIVVNSANAIGDAFGQAFQKLVTGAASAKQVLSDFFQSVANAFFEMASQIIAKQLVMITLQAILKALGGAPGGGNMAAVDKYASTGAGSTMGDFPMPAFTNAKGNAFSPQGHMEAYAKGGVIKAPTLFRYANGGGGFNTGLMGEAGPEAILPLRRTPDGRLGVTQVRSPQGGDTRMSEMMGRSPAQQQAPTLNLKFETTTINGVEYVSREQLEVAMAQTRRQAANDGAKRGMTMTLDKMRNSPRTRAQVGMR